MPASGQPLLANTAFWSLGGEEGPGGAVWNQLEGSPAGGLPLGSAPGPCPPPAALAEATWFKLQLGPVTPASKCTISI